jgi:hypothetical protein
LSVSLCVFVRRFISNCASFNESLGTPYTTQSETITITLRISGNPVVAAEPYTFYIALDVNQCNSAPLDSYQ